MSSKNNNLVFEMIDKLESDDTIKEIMKKIFSSELSHTNATSAKKAKVTYCREVVEKVVK